MPTRPWTLLSDPLLIRAVRGNIRDPATAEQSQVMQGSDLFREMQSGDKRVTAGDTVLYQKTPNAVFMLHTLQSGKCTIECSLHKPS